MHSLHPIRGFPAGIIIQIIHEKASSISRKKDTLNLCLSTRSWNFFIWLFTSWISSENFSICVWIPLLSVGTTVRLLFIGGRAISISGSSFPVHSHFLSVLFNQPIWHGKHFAGSNFPEGSTLWKSNDKVNIKGKERLGRKP